MTVGHDDELFHCRGQSGIRGLDFKGMSAYGGSDERPRDHLIVRLVLAARCKKEEA